MLLKVGDKLLCKNELKVPTGSGNYMITIKHENYIVFIVDYNSNFITFEYCGFVFNLLGAINKNIDSGYDSQYHIWDYFYTEKEVRKLKLERINNEFR